MHIQGRGLFSVLLKNLPDIDARTVRETAGVGEDVAALAVAGGDLGPEVFDRLSQFLEGSRPA